LVAKGATQDQIEGGGEPEEEEEESFKILFLTIVLFGIYFSSFYPLL
jgi:hypothetical protein